MTKCFCDICGEQCEPEIHSELELERGIIDSRCKIVVRSIFTFRYHPTGFSGPPDLCARCRAKLMMDLARKIDTKAEPHRLRQWTLRTDSWGYKRVDGPNLDAKESVVVQEVIQ